MKITISGKETSYSQRLKTPSLTSGTVEEKRAELLNYFKQVYDWDEDLYISLMASDAAYYKTADPLRHPIIFYFGKKTSK